MSVTEGVVPAIRILVGRYEVGELIGRGGMSDVHVGTDNRLGRRVAIKLLKPSLAADPVFRTRFRREAQDAAKMAHPTIVRIFDAGEEMVTDATGAQVHQPFIIMEFVDGRLLKDIISAGPLDPAEATRIAAQVLVALEYSHRAGVVHRDIKPGNIMLTATGQVKVMDFGIARAVSDSSANLAETSSIVGTAQYFSPEQARGETVDARTDLYSTGIVLFEMLTGRAPFRGDNPVAIAYQHVNQAPVPPSSANPKVSPALDAVVLRSLAKDPFDRFQSAHEFRSDLELAAAGEVPQHSKSATNDFQATLFGVNPSATADSEATLRRLAVATEARAARTQNRPPVAWIWAGIVFMAVVIVAVIFWTLNLAPTRLTDAVAIEVPAVAGQSWEDGSALLTSLELTPQRFSEISNSVDEGDIIGTDPQPGTNVSPGQIIKVFVSSGKTPVAVPDVRNMLEATARAGIEARGLTPGSTTLDYSPSVAKDVVINTNPAAGSLLREGDTVDLIVSNGLVNVPSVVGMDAGPASAALNALQLQVKVITNGRCGGGKVDQQSLPPGDQQQKAEITIRVCAG